MNRAILGGNHAYLCHRNAREANSEDDKIIGGCYIKGEGILGSTPNMYLRQICNNKSKPALRVVYSKPNSSQE